MDVQIANMPNLHVRCQGQGDHATLLLHGWSVSGRVWDEVALRWPRHLGTLLVPDLRGSGWSSKPASGYSLGHYVIDVLALIRLLNLRRVTIVGHSLGGGIAERIALEPALPVDRLLLVSPVPALRSPLDPETVGFYRAQAGRHDGCAQVLKGAMARELPSRLNERLLADAATVSVEAYVEGLDAWCGAPPSEWRGPGNGGAATASRPRAAAEPYRMSFGEPAAPDDGLGAIRVPTVVIGGDADPYVPPRFLKGEVASHIPGATFRVVRDSGHYPQLETPDAFCDVLFSALCG